MENSVVFLSSKQYLSVSAEETSLSCYAVCLTNSEPLPQLKDFSARL